MILMIIIGISRVLLLALVAAGALVALVLIAGFLYQFLGGLRDRKRLRTSGRLVPIGNRRCLYLVEKGPAPNSNYGRPTVVFESGFGATSLNWTHIQDALADQVHTVAYDRCGLGWSSPCRSERTPEHVASELHALLLAARMQPPWILVGHSFGGLVMQRFALDHPAETAAVLLIDPMRPIEWPPFNAAADARIARAQRLTRIGGICARIGLTRLAARSHFCRSARLSGALIRRAGKQGAYLADRLNTEIGKMPAEVRPSIAAHWSAPRFYRGLLAHLRAVSATAVSMYDPEPIRDTPVALLTPAGGEPIANPDQYGPQSRQIIAQQSLHWIHLDEPGLVIRTILELVDQTRTEIGEQRGARTLAFGD
jgi:pimeloyl-ACP methyl ester carboxylesterase